MKIIVLLPFLLLFAFTSCKKDRSCTCTNQDGSLYSTGTIFKSTKKEAKAVCTTTKQGVTCVVK